MSGLPRGFIHPQRRISFSQRLAVAGRTLLATLFSPRLFTVLKSLFLDLIMQKRVLDKNSLRWIAHALIFTGFLLLFFLHALDTVVTAKLFSGYVSTLNPYLFLRNLFGLMVLAGIAIAVYRRITLKPQRLRTYASDWAALIFIGGIILSGMLLEGTKMSSYSTFQRMVEDYGDVADDQEQQALEAFWVKENGLVVSHGKLAVTDELVEPGPGDQQQELHRMSRRQHLGLRQLRPGQDHRTDRRCGRRRRGGKFPLVPPYPVLSVVSCLAALFEDVSHHRRAGQPDHHPDHGQRERRTGKCPDPADDRALGLHPLRRLQPGMLVEHVFRVVSERLHPALGEGPVSQDISQPEKPSTTTP